MAFSDVRDRNNLEGYLVAGITLTAAAGDVNVIVGDRWITEDIGLPSPWTGKPVNGIVQSWGDFGSEADMLRGEMITGDGSITLTNQRLLDGTSLPGFLATRALLGTPLEIFQVICDPMTSTQVSKRIFYGRVSNLAYPDAGRIRIDIIGVYNNLGMVPYTSVSSVDFEDAGENVPGTFLPIVYGRHIGSSTEFDFASDQWNYCPAYLLKKGKGSSNLGHYAAAAHPLHIVSIVGVQESGISELASIESLIGGGDFTSYPDGILSTEYGGVAIHDDARARAVVIPLMDYGSTASDGENAWDSDHATFATLDGTHKILQGKMAGIQQLGTLEMVEVWAHILNGGSGTVEVGMGDGTGFYPNSSDTFNAATGWSNTRVYCNDVSSWDLDGHYVRCEVGAGETAYIAELRVAIRYIPYAGGQLAQWLAQQGPPSNSGTMWHSGVSGDFQKIPNNVITLPARPSGVIVGLQGLEDDESGTYTGSASSLIENPADIARHLLVEHSPVEDSDLASGAEFGSFATARSLLNPVGAVEWRLAPWLGGKPEPIETVFNEICLQSRSRPIQNADGKIGMIVLPESPTADYRGGAFAFESGVHFEADSFECGITSIDEVYTRIRVRYDYSPYQNDFRGLTFVHEDSSDDGTGTRDESGSGGREELAAARENLHKTTREYEYAAHYIRDQWVAVCFRNFLFDQLSRPRVWISFLAGRAFCDLSVGNIIPLADSTINGMLAPSSYGGFGYFSAFKWLVESVTRIAQPDQPATYRITALEAVKALASGDWSPVSPG